MQHIPNAHMIHLIDNNGFLIPLQYTDIPYKNLEHALHTLCTQFAFVLYSFCALVNHILHMCKMCVVSKILGTCAKRAQEVYICNMCAVCAQVVN